MALTVSKRPTGEKLSVAMELGMNIFDALFAYRPRDGMTPEENFLTASFAAALANNSDFCAAFVEWASNGQLTRESIAHAEVQTQVCLRMLDAHPIRPDMQVAVRTNSRDLVLIRSEHKWRSSFDPNQVGLYRAIDVPKGASVLTVFLSSIDADIQRASHACDRAGHWRDMGRLALPFTSSDSILRHWTEFLRSQGLMSDAPSVVHNPLPTQLIQIALQMLKLDDRWAWVPSELRKRRRVEKPSWGRIGVYFGLADGPFGKKNTWCWFAGFRFENEDVKKMPIEDSAIGCDLMLALHGPKQIVLDDGLLSAAVARVHAAEPRESWPTRARSGALSESPWYKLIVTAPCSDLGVSPANQDAFAEAAAAKLARWGELVLQDAKLKSHLASQWGTQ